MTTAAHADVTTMRRTRKQSSSCQRSTWTWRGVQACGGASARRGGLRHIVSSRARVSRLQGFRARDVPNHVVRDGADPGAEGIGLLQAAQAAQCAEEGLLHRVGDVVGRQARKRDRVHHARIASIELAEGGRVAVLSRPHEARGLVRRLGCRECVMRPRHASEDCKFIAHGQLESPLFARSHLLRRLLTNTDAERKSLR